MAVILPLWVHTHTCATCQRTFQCDGRMCQNNTVRKTRHFCAFHWKV